MKQSKIVLISIVSLILILSYQNCSGNFESIAISSESEKDSSPERQSAPVDEIKITDTVLELQSVENITFESAEIIVQLNNASQAYIEYGTSDKYGEETLLKDKYLLTHIQKLNGLSPNTKYNYRIHFTDEEGREFISQNFIFKTEQKSENISDNIDKKPLMEDSSNPPQGTCFNPWDDNGMHLQKRVKRLMLSPYRSGFGEKTIGGTKNLVVVTNPAITGGGSYRDIITKAKPGDYIVFDHVLCLGL